MCLKPLSAVPWAFRKIRLKSEFEFDPPLHMWNGDPGPDWEMGPPEVQPSPANPLGPAAEDLCLSPSRAPLPPPDLPGLFPALQKPLWPLWGGGRPCVGAARPGPSPEKGPKGVKDWCV